MKRITGKDKVLLFLVGVLVVIGFGFVGWFRVASNYDYDALAGTYVMDGAGEKCIVELYADGNFSEQLMHSGTTKLAQGKWTRYGESHMSFSPEFMTVSGEELNASGQTHGQFEKMLGVFPSLTLAPLPGGPTFRKRWF